MAAKKRGANLGTVREIRPGTWRAEYERTINGKRTRHSPGHTFASEKLAWQWLRAERQLIDLDQWTPPAERRAAAEREAHPVTFGEYSQKWIDERQVKGRPLRPRTRDHYLDLRARWMAPLLDRPLADITPEEAAAWYRRLPADKETMRSHCYALARSVFASALEDRLITEHPLHIRGAARHVKATEVDLFTAAEIQQLADAMPEPHRCLLLLAAWCGLRMGELCALRRSDVELHTKAGQTTGKIHVRRAAVTIRTPNEPRKTTRVESETKSDAGRRTVTIPPHIVPEVKRHLKKHAQWGADGQVFPPSNPATSYLTSGQIYGHATKHGKDGQVLEAGTGWYGARESIGRPELSFHKLRHFAGTSYAIAGATQRELMAMMGHADAEVALRYQHVAQDRQAALAARMSELAGEEPATR